MTTLRPSMIAPALISMLIVSAAIDRATPELAIHDGVPVFLSASGVPVPDDELVGSTFTIADPAERDIVVRIKRILPDPNQGSAVRKLYDVEVRDPDSGGWAPLCSPGPAGLALAVPLPGIWTRDGRYRPLDGGRFTFICTSSARVKCLRRGYAPWRRNRPAPKPRSVAPGV